MLFLFSFLAMPQFIVCQNTREVDSLNNLLAATDDEVHKADILNPFAELYRTNKFNESLDYARKAYNLSRDIGYAEGLVDALSKMGAIYARKSDYVKALKMAKKADSIALAKNLTFTEWGNCLSMEGITRIRLKTRGQV
jgi:tetratricopeptide (TPR) repeat protein